MPSKVDLTGQRFGRLIVDSVAGQDRFRAYLWRCKCDCGSSTTVRSSTLRQGKTTSCGCFARDVKSMPRTHGMSRTTLYYRWRSMHDRTGNPRFPDYHNYGGRGIAVCARWRQFENFYEDMAEGFAEHLELDRIDVNGDYTPDNCRWATRKEQQRNRRNNHVVAWQGRSQTVQEWGEMLGIKPNTLIYRLRRGWPVSRALTKGAKPTALLELANAGDL